ncbi:MAG: hypothetical protein ACI4JZ_10235 [Oscillospiraceae bacterium]
MSADVAELLFDTFVSGAGKAKELYKPLVGFDECDKRLQHAYERHGLTLEQQNGFDEIIGDMTYTAEQHEFEQGLKLGLRLAAEALCSREEA